MTPRFLRGLKKIEAKKKAGLGEYAGKIMGISCEDLTSKSSEVPLGLQAYKDRQPLLDKEVKYEL